MGMQIGVAPGTVNRKASRVAEVQRGCVPSRRNPEPRLPNAMTDPRLPYPRRARAQGALAVELDDPQRQPSCGQTCDGLKVGGHQASSASLSTIMTALYFAVLQPGGPGGGEAACEPDLPRHPVSARPSDAGEARESSAATRARNPIRRAPRMSTTSISPPARSASAWRRRSLPASCRIM